MLAYVTYFQRRFDEAEALASAVISDAKRWGDTWALLMMQTLLANMRLWTGRIAEAETLAERALAGFRESDDRYGVMSALGPLTRAQVALGKNADAQRGAEESISLGHSFGELGLALQGAAAVAMHLGDADQALVLSEQVIARHHAMGSSDAEAVVIRSLALSQLGRIDEAMASIEAVDVADFPFGQSARALVRALAGDPAGALKPMPRRSNVLRGQLLRPLTRPSRRRRGGPALRRRGSPAVLVRPAADDRHERR